MPSVSFSLDTETIRKVEHMKNVSGKTLSSVLTLLVKRGFAYTALLEQEDIKKKTEGTYLKPKTDR